MTAVEVSDYVNTLYTDRCVYAFNDRHILERIEMMMFVRKPSLLSLNSIHSMYKHSIFFSCCFVLFIYLFLCVLWCLYSQHPIQTIPMTKKKKKIEKNLKLPNETRTLAIRPGSVAVANHEWSGWAQCQTKMLTAMVAANFRSSAFGLCRRYCWQMRFFCSPSLE